jgi:hypothetical protein
MREPTCDVTPDGTYVFEMEFDDGRRVVAPIFPEDIDEVTGPPSAEPVGAEERKRRFTVARLLAETELRRQIDEE